MDFKETLAGMKKEIDKELKLQFDSVIKSVQKEDILLSEALKQVKKIALAGGKRIRGALLCQAYFGAGGKNKKEIMKAAAAIELLHMFFLVHDDIMDKGMLRHGEKTLQAFFSEKKQKYMSASEAEHFGNSIAIIGGDMLYVMANKIILKTRFNIEAVTQSLGKLQSTVETTIIGQSQDMKIAQEKQVNEKKVLSMYANKTAQYTFENPLHIGAILAGKNNQRLLQCLSRYAINVGTAFQIQDDILGVFGNEKKTGKLSVSDIEEGKKSVMVIKAYKKANPEQKKQLNSILGKKGLTKKEINIFQNILKSTGALKYAQKMSANYLAKGKREIKKMALLPKARIFLTGLIAYLESREA